MNRLILAAILAAAFGVAYADPPHNNCNGNGSCGTTNNVTNQGGNATIQRGAVEVENKNYNTNTNVNVNSQGQHQGQGQGQSQSANNQGNAQNVTIENNVPKQAPSGPGVASSPSATCRIAVGLSVGVVGFSGGGFGSVLDEDCRKHEQIRMLKEVLARPDAAKKLACTDAAMAEAMGDCPAPKKAEATPTVPTATKTAAVQQPQNCIADPFIAARMGAPVCK